MSGWRATPPPPPVPEWRFQIEVARRKRGRFGGPPTLDFAPPAKRATDKPMVRYRVKHDDWLVSFEGRWTMAVPERDIPARRYDLMQLLWSLQPEIVRAEPYGMPAWQHRTERAADLIRKKREQRRQKAGAAA